MVTLIPFIFFILSNENYPLLSYGFFFLSFWARSGYWWEGREHCFIYVTMKVVSAYFGKVLFKKFSFFYEFSAYSVFTEEGGLTLNFHNQMQPETDWLSDSN